VARDGWSCHRFGGLGQWLPQLTNDVAHQLRALHGFGAVALKAQFGVAGQANLALGLHQPQHRRGIDRRVA